MDVMEEGGWMMWRRVDGCSGGGWMVEGRVIVVEWVDNW